MRVLVNAANLHRGGGVAVASSVIDSLSRMPDLEEEITVLASTKVARNLAALESPVSSFTDYIVFDMVGFRALWSRLPVNPRDYDAVLNVFGPVYSLALARGSVMGFAQPWIAFPDSAAHRRLGLPRRVRVAAKNAVQKVFFSLARVLVVEQEAVRAALLSRRGLRSRPIAVVPNTVDSIFLDSRRWATVRLPDHGGDLSLGVVAANHPHKNLAVFPEVRHILRTRHGIEASFFVTLSDTEWDELASEMKSEVVNLGSLGIAESAAVTAQLDAVVLPTLLECFSATPIEAMAVGTPLFASDLATISETVGAYAVYFDPEDPADIASKIAHAFPLLTERRAARDTPTQRVPGYRDVDETYTAEKRARRLLAVVGQASGCRAVVETRRGSTNAVPGASRDLSTQPRGGAHS